MKVVVFDDNLNVIEIEENIYKPIIVSFEKVEWTGGSKTVLEGKFLLCEDDYSIEVGEKADEILVVNQMKERMKGKVNENVNKACTKGFTSNVTGWTYETESHDQTNFSRRMLTLLRKQDVNVVNWKIADGSIREHTREQFLEVCDELDDFITSKVNSGWKIKNEDIENASTFQELIAINLEVE